MKKPDLSKLKQLPKLLRRKKPQQTKWNPTTTQPTSTEKMVFAPPKTESKLFKPISFKPQKVWHFSFLRTINRLVAAIVFFFNITFFLGTVGQSNVVWFSVFFFINAYICLKYLWNSKKVKIEFET